jgi:4-amino-4-deoxy-L-arabinose transferase-like glycosyltransferase
MLTRFLGIGGRRGRGSRMSGPVDTVRPSVEHVRPSTRFLRALFVIAIVGLVMRVAYVLVSSAQVGGDGLYYHAIAGLVRDGKGFIAPGPYAKFGQAIQTAPHPPGWPLVLIGAAFVGLRTTLEQQVIACLIGTATIVTVGFAGRRIAGPRVGLVAATIAAMYPNFWLYERELMSETLTLFLAATTILLAYRFRDRPTRARAIALGISCGALAITHAEQTVLIAVLLLPVILLGRGPSRKERIAWAAMAVAAAILVILPWAAYNTERFDTPVLLGTQFGVTFAVSNCASVYSGHLIGFQDDQCSKDAMIAGKIPGIDDPTRDNEYLHVGLDYARAHASRVPVVVLAREARTWGLWPSQLHLDDQRGTPYYIVALGYLFYWLLVPFAIVGAVTLRRRRVMELPLLAFFVTCALSVALTYGFTRFRAAAEVAIVLLAAVAVERALRWLTT